MVGTYLTPGVYVEEPPGGARAIEGVSTSNTLFMGYTRRGPVDPPDAGEPADLAVRISSWAQYVEQFGGVVGGQSQGINDYRTDANAPQRVDLMGHAVFSYFQNGGRIAYVRRMVAEVPGVNAGDPPIAPLATSIAAVGAPATLVFEAVNPGTWADGLEVQVNPQPGAAGRFVVLVGRRDDNDRFIPFEQHTDVGVVVGDDGYIGDVLEQRSDLLRLLSTDVATARHRGTTDVSGMFPLDLNGQPRGLQIRLNPNENNAAGQLETAIPEAVYATADELAAAMQDAIRTPTGQAGASAPAIVAGATVTAVEVGGTVVIEITGGLDPDGGAVAARCQVQAFELGATLGFVAGDASQASTATSGTFAYGADGVYADAQAHVDALTLFELNDDINVIVTPNAPVDGDPAGGQPVVDEVLAHCERMRDRVYVLDPPQGQELADTNDVIGLGMPTSTYTVSYYPWIRVANPIHHPDLRPDAPRTVLVPPSGFATGMWSRIDSRRGVWKAPAGVETNLTGVIGFEHIVGDAAQEVLNPNGINALRERRGYGNVVWGARTLATRANPEWRYVPVRRTAIMIEKALRSGIQWAVFEPNDHLLWSSLRLSAEAYLNGLFRAGAFQGAKASDAYGVSCGLGATMTQGDIDRGYVVLRVAFAPLKPAEFVVIQIQQLVGQS